MNIFLNAKVVDLPHDLFSFNETQKKKTICLLGSGGRELWEKLPNKNSANPFDDYSIQCMKTIDPECEILYPQTPFHFPLQKLSRFFGFSTQSPIGIDISNEFGLWFAFRGVFLTEKNLPPTPLSSTSFPCEKCAERPCLNGIDISTSRLLCPIKTEHQYTLLQLEHHKNALKLL